MIDEGAIESDMDNSWTIIFPSLDYDIHRVLFLDELLRG